MLNCFIVIRKEEFAEGIPEAARAVPLGLHCPGARRQSYAFTPAPGALSLSLSISSAYPEQILQVAEPAHVNGQLA